MVLAWEAGANLGHFLRVKAIIDHWHKRGRNLVLGMSPLVAHRHASQLGLLPCTKVVVGVAHSNEAGTSNPASFAGVLAAQGWINPQWLSAQLKDWLDLFEELRPSSVVLDYAPVAALASYGLRVPAIHVSSGFDAPPVEQLGIGRSRAQTGEISLAEAREIARIDDGLINITRAERRLPTDIHLQAALAYPVRILDCLAQTDPYGARTKAQYTPFVPSEAGATVSSWPEFKGQQQKRAYVYLRNRSATDLVLRALADRQVSTLCFWPGDGAGGLTHQYGASVGVHSQPLNLRQVLPQASLVISYASVGLATQSILAGVPQLLLPTDVEKQMVAQRLHQQRLGWWIDGKNLSRNVEVALDRLLDGQHLSLACKEAQFTARRHLPKDSL